MRRINCGFRSLKGKASIVNAVNKLYSEVMNIWKSYMCFADWRIIWMKIIAVKYATFAVAKRKPEKKNQACAGFEPLTSEIPVQRSTKSANKPTGSRSLNWVLINPWKDDDEVMNIWKSVYVNCGVKNYMNEDFRSYIRNFCSCEKEAWKKLSLSSCLQSSTDFLRIGKKAWIRRTSQHETCLLRVIIVIETYFI